VPVMRFRNTEPVREPEARVIVWMQVPLSAVAVRDDAALATPSIPVWSFAAVTSVLTQAVISSVTVPQQAVSAGFFY
jgi:hypothetical protein